jgi:hypothetical protein
MFYETHMTLRLRSTLQKKLEYFYSKCYVFFFPFVSRVEFRVSISHHNTKKGDREEEPFLLHYTHNMSVWEVIRATRRGLIHWGRSTYTQNQRSRLLQELHIWTPEEVFVTETKTPQQPDQQTAPRTTRKTTKQKQNKKEKTKEPLYKKRKVTATVQSIPQRFETVQVSWLPTQVVPSKPSADTYQVSDALWKDDCHRILMAHLRYLGWAWSETPLVYLDAEEAGTTRFLVQQDYPLEQCFLVNIHEDVCYKLRRHVDVPAPVRIFHGRLQDFLRQPQGRAARVIYADFCGYAQQVQELVEVLQEVKNPTEDKLVMFTFSGCRQRTHITQRAQEDHLPPAHSASLPLLTFAQLQQTCLQQRTYIPQLMYLYKSPTRPMWNMLVYFQVGRL